MVETDHVTGQLFEACCTYTKRVWSGAQAITILEIKFIKTIILILILILMMVIIIILILII